MNKRILIVIFIILIILGSLLILNLGKKDLAPSQDKGAVVSLSALLTELKSVELKGELLQAQAIYQKLVNEFSSSMEVMNWQKKLEDINIKLLFSPQVSVNSLLYEIKPGDTLTKIAGTFKTTTDLIMKSNNLLSDRIIPGKKVKVFSAPFNIFVDKSQNTLILKTGEDIIKTYVVSTGKDNCTPVGSFKIVNKLPNPTWFKAGTVAPPGSLENVLGTRWLGFDLAGYGIHGTVEPQNLGKQVTQGCVRMLNAEVEELYTIVPVGTEVTIVD